MVSMRDQLRVAGQQNLGTWIEAATGNEIWSIQHEVATALSVPRAKVAVPSCNASGKTFLAARLAPAHQGVAQGCGFRRGEIQFGDLVDPLRQMAQRVTHFPCLRQRPGAPITIVDDPRRQWCAVAANDQRLVRVVRQRAAERLQRACPEPEAPIRCCAATVKKIYSAPIAVAETYSTPMRGQQYGSSSPAPRPKQPISIRRRGPTRSDQRPTCTAMNREKIEYSENRMPTSNGVPPKSIAYNDTSILLPL